MKVWISLGIVGLVIAVLFMSYITAHNSGNALEQKIVAVYENNEQILGQYGQKVQEAARVPGMMTEDLQKVVTGAMSGRYGNDGAKQTMLWVKENYPGQVDASLYTKIQQIIEAGRNDFTVAQSQLVDVKRTYRTKLGSFWSGMWMKMAGYPNIKVGYPTGSQDDYPAISTTRAKKTFKTGVEEGPIKLR